MKTGVLCPIIMVILACAALNVEAQAQNRGRLGFTLDAQRYPQAGFQWNVSDRLALRATTYLGVGRGTDDFILSVFPSYSFHLDEKLSTYVGPDVTYFWKSGDVFGGAIWGSRYHIDERFAIFGELGVSFYDTRYGVGDFDMSNTGAGVIFYVAR